MIGLVGKANFMNLINFYFIFLLLKSELKYIFSNFLENVKKSKIKNIIIFLFEDLFLLDFLKHIGNVLMLKKGLHHTCWVNVFEGHHEGTSNITNE